VSDEKQHFTVRASASRLEKGFLAIPQKFGHLFPDEKSRIDVIFDDESETRSLTFHPHDPVVKENRVFGLARWFSARNVEPGDLITITVEDRQKRIYRVALDRYVKERQEQQVRHKLRTAATDSEAERELGSLSSLTSRRPRRVAHEELLRIATESPVRPRPTVLPAMAERHEGVPSGIRVLLRELHGGKCQLCGFTFEKRDGQRYFEIHHLDPKIGHHPTNLLVVCPNCHAQFEYATVTDFRWAGVWLVGVRINGKQLTINQPLAHDSIRRTLLGWVIVLAAIRFARLFGDRRVHAGD